MLVRSSAWGRTRTRGPALRRPHGAPERTRRCRTLCVAGGSSLPAPSGLDEGPLKTTSRPVGSAKRPTGGSRGRDATRSSRRGALRVGRTHITVARGHHARFGGRRVGRVVACGRPKDHDRPGQQQERSRRHRVSRALRRPRSSRLAHRTGQGSTPARKFERRVPSRAVRCGRSRLRPPRTRRP